MLKIPPCHPSSNLAETFMKPLGKIKWIAHHNKTPEEEALGQLLQNYRNTPHPATGVSPKTMMFCDSVEGIFPRVWPQR